MSKQISQNTVVFLYKLASLFSSRRFLTLFNSAEYRFQGNPVPLFDKLRSSLLFQVRQSLPGDYLRGFREVTGHSDVPIHSAIKMLAKQLKALADRIDADRCTRKADMRFSVPKDTTLLDTVFEQFNSSVTHTVCVELSRMDGPCSPVCTFDERNVISSFGIFVEALHTLGRKTPYPAFESMLTDLLGQVDYFVNGYPHDILAHDVRTLREHSNIESIMVREDYCSSAVVTEHSDLPPNMDGYRVYAL